MDRESGVKRKKTGARKRKRRKGMLGAASVCRVVNADFQMSRLREKFTELRLIIF